MPKLEATEDELKKFDPPKDAKAQEPPAAPLPPLPPSYPPLESGALIARTGNAAGRPFSLKAESA